VADILPWIPPRWTGFPVTQPYAFMLPYPEAKKTKTKTKKKKK